MELTTAWFSMAISGVLSLAVYSFLYRENSAFRFAEHILLGSFTGHTLVMAVKNINETGVARIVSGELVYIIPVILGILLFARYFKDYAWITRYSFAVLIGITAGVEARARFHGWIWKRVTETLSTPLTDLSAIIILVAMLAVMSYFTFTVKHTGAVNIWARIGRGLLLMTFGMTIAMDMISRTGSVTARFSWMIENIPIVSTLGVLVLGAFIVYEFTQGKAPKPT